MLCSLDRANVGVSKGYQIIKEQVGSFDNVGFTLKDAENFSRDLKAKLIDSDAHVFIQNFQILQEKYPSFYYAYELNEHDHLKHVFWADSLARDNFAMFGDITSFDTTYNTNKYSMIFAPFTGINHHRLTITFGAAFIADEKTESFIWLFQKFVDCMGKEPNLIVTDQDPAMTSAIRKTFPHSHQRQKELKADHDTLNGNPKLKTNLPLESHASLIYTHKNFYIFQEEIWSSCMTCGVKSSNALNDNGNLNSTIFTIIDSSMTNARCRDVFINPSTISCTCKMYETQGIPCRHMLLVLKGQSFNEIPHHCILKRWTRMSISQNIIGMSKTIYVDASSSDYRRRLISNAWTSFSHCIEVAKDSDEALIELATCAANWEKERLVNDYTDSMTKHMVQENSSTMPTQVEILPSIQSKTKGSGKRIKGGIELAIAKQKKGRLCRKCGEHGLHDSRNCPNQKSNDLGTTTTEH